MLLKNVQYKISNISKTKNNRIPIILYDEL